MNQTWLHFRVNLYHHLLAEVLQHIVHDAYDSELELAAKAEMQATRTGIDLTSFAAENVVLAFYAHLRGNAVILGVELFGVVPSDDDVYSKFGAMQTVGDDAVAVDVAAADDDAAALDVVEVVVPTAGYAYAAVLAASEIAGSSRYYSYFQENLKTQITFFLRHF